jgi:amidophosphoribosyltransferase
MSNTTTSSVGDDHPREECGMFRVIGNPDASSLCYLGLQKLQHRGEEGAGIVVPDTGGKLNTYTVTDLGLVEDVFQDPTPLANLLENKKYQTCS